MDYSENTSEVDLEAILTRLHADYSNLLVSLEAERAALKSQDHVCLTEATDKKAQVCSQIEAVMGTLPAPLADLVAQAASEDREKLDRLHTQLCDTAREAKDFNAVNGKIIHRSQQSVRELIGVLNGHESNALYGAHGTSLQGHPSAGPAIANA